MDGKVGSVYRSIKRRTAILPNSLCSRFDQGVAQPDIMPAAFSLNPGHDIRNEVDHPYSFQVLSPMLALRYEALPYADEVKMHQAFFDWIQYNFLWEPDGAGFLIDESICDRYGFPYQPANPGDTSKDDANLLWARYIPQAAAYRPTAQERDAARKAWAQGSWSDIKPYPQCQYMDMTNFNLPFFHESEPDSREKKAAIASLAYIQRDRFTEYRVDPPRDFEFLFVRRPSYYRLNYAYPSNGGIFGEVIIQACLRKCWVASGFTQPHDPLSSDAPVP